MNCLIQALAHICQKHLLEEKWLIAPSYRTGNQWLETVARSGQPVLNVHVKTLNSMALDLAAVEMAARGVTFLSGRAGGLLVDRIMQVELQDRLSYLNQVEPSARLADVILSSIHAMRLAGLSPSDLSKNSFEVPEKGEDIMLILDAYRRLLVSEKKTDYADVLRIAVDRLSSDPGSLGPDILLLVPEDLELTVLERNLITNVGTDRLRMLSVDGLPGVSDPSDSIETKTDLDLMPCILDPAAAPAPFGDGTVAVTHSIGEVSEVRGVLRHCIEQGIPWDEVEILHTDADAYVPLIYETFTSMDPGGSDTDEELPLTLREGIPCRYSRPGRALAAWFQWVREIFPQTALVKMVREGLLEPPGGEESISGFTRLAVLLRGMAVGFGRERYLPRFAEQIRHLSSRLKFLERSRESESDISPARIEGIRSDLRDLEVLQSTVSNLLDNAPDDRLTQLEIVTRAKNFLRTAARCVNRLDRYAKQALIDELEDMEYWLSRENRETGIDVWEWLGSLTAGTSVLGSGPRPGCLHVDSVQSGGHSGRRHTFIVGLDDSRFPGRGLQDPLLLDSERLKLSPEIPTAGGRLEKKIENFARLLARLDGQVTFSFSSRNMIEDRDMFPSSILLPIYRLLTGDTGGDQESLLRWLPQPESIAPTDPGRCLDKGEWWLWRLTGHEPVEEPAALVHERFPHLARGTDAEVLRAGKKYTPYDGLVPQAGTDLDPTTPDGPVMSSSRLQTMGRCPRAFFFEYGLGIEPPEELIIDARQWLDPLSRGSLLHELFEEFMRRRIDEDRLPEYGRDLPELERLLEKKAAEYRELCPPPGESVYLSELNGLRDTALTFLREEEQYFARKDRSPLFLEASIGLPSGTCPTALDTNDPVSLRLPGGGTIRARGRVDRIDRVGGSGIESYHIWDYKTGSARYYSKSDPLQQGRKIQPYLYVKIVDDCLRRSVSPKANVSAFGFFFPDTRAVGERLTWTPDELDSGGQVIERLCQTIASGAFVATNNTGVDCTYCSYKPICGNLETLGSASLLKLKNGKNTILEPFRDLRGIPVEEQAEQLHSKRKSE